MKGPALWLKNYVRCRQVMSVAEWTVLLGVAAGHGEWVSRSKLRELPVRCRATTSTVVRQELGKLQAAELVQVREVKAPRGDEITLEARITNKGFYFLGWPELTVPYCPPFEPAAKS
jgi:hypothetical protein